MIDLRDVRDRLQAAATKSPTERRAGLAAELDSRLVDEPDWPATTQTLQDARDQGHDVTAAAHALTAEAPLGDQPARDLRNRIVTRLDISIDIGETPIATPPRRHERQETPRQPTPRRSVPRR